jgi:hypothetical protein
LHKPDRRQCDGSIWRGLSPVAVVMSGAQRRGFTWISSRRGLVASPKKGPRLRHTQSAMAPAETVGRVRREETSPDDGSIRWPATVSTFAHQGRDQTEGEKALPRCRTQPPRGEPSTRANVGNRYLTGLPLANSKGTTGLSRPLPPSPPNVLIGRGQHPCFSGAFWGAIASPTKVPAFSSEKARPRPCVFRFGRGLKWGYKP